MLELYTISIQEGRLALSPRTDAALCKALEQSLPPEGCALTASLGDPELMHCGLFRHEKAGGVFLLQDPEGLLFAAVAESNLAWAHGLGHWGRLVSYARYGADIFENPGGIDD